MAICHYFGNADLFITRTANPNWREIKDELQPHQTVADCPDLVARVFQMKKSASVWAVEFQKQGLPHVRLILFLKSERKLRSPDDFVNMIHTDISDLVLEPCLHELVVANMMHTCSKMRCLDEHGKCNRKFPKPYVERTTMAENEYAQIQRVERVVNIFATCEYYSRPQIFVLPIFVRVRISALVTTNIREYLSEVI